MKAVRRAGLMVTWGDTVGAGAGWRVLMSLWSDTQEDVCNLYNLRIYVCKEAYAVDILFYIPTPRYLKSRYVKSIRNVKASPGSQICGEGVRLIRMLKTRLFMAAWGSPPLGEVNYFSVWNTVFNANYTSPPEHFLHFLCLCWLYVFKTWPLTHKMNHFIFAQWKHSGTLIHHNKKHQVRSILSYDSILRQSRHFEF